MVFIQGATPAGMSSERKQLKLVDSSAKSQEHQIILALEKEASSTRYLVNSL